MYAFVPLSTPVPLQAAVSVSSRNFKKAVDRNKIKRQLREVYRLQKQPLFKTLQEKNVQLVLFFIYTGKDLPAYEDLFLKIEKMIVKLQQIVETKTTSN